MYSAFINQPPMTKTLATIPALFAKSSLVWPAILNLILLNRERKKFLDTLVEEGSKLIRSVKIRRSTASKKSHVSINNINLTQNFGDSTQYSAKSSNQVSLTKDLNKPVDHISSTKALVKELGANLNKEFASHKNSDVFIN
jgi:hypothetical protein